MSVVDAWVFDGLDSESDLEIIGGKFIYGGDLSTDTPGGVGKSWHAYNSNHLILSIPEQAGKTVNVLAKIKINSSSDSTLFWVSPSVINNDISPQIKLAYNQSLARLELYRGATLLAYGSHAVPLSAFNTYQIEYLIHSSSGKFKVFINGNTTADIDYTGNTQNQASDSVRSLRFGADSNWCPNMYVYGVICANSDGSVDNGRIPANAAYSMVSCVSDGATIWTPNSGSTAYTQIDEALGAPNDDTDYVKTSTLNAKNICGVQNISGAGRIIMVQGFWRAKRNATGTCGVKFGTKVGADENQSSEYFLPATYGNYKLNITTKDGANAFTQSDINAPLQLTAQLTTAG